MSAPFEQQPNHNQLIERDLVLHQVYDLDPALAEHEQTRQLVEIGTDFILQVSQQHGAPDAPRWHQGSREATIMTYHNGQSEHASGHSSIGVDGAGVPRGSLLLAAHINRAAGEEIVRPVQRALLFAASASHDVVQLCGRSFDNTNGDEEQSANLLRNRLLEAGFTQDLADEGATYVMATMFNPAEMRQAIQTEGQPEHTVLGQQIIAAADLMSLATSRGPLGAMEWTLEELGLRTKNHALQHALDQQHQTTSEIRGLSGLLSFVDSTPSLKAQFTASLEGQGKFARGLQYQDDAIRRACGQGVDDFFPNGREQTAQKLEQLADQAEQGVGLHELWAQAKLHSVARPLGYSALQ